LALPSLGRKHKYIYGNYATEEASSVA